MKRRNWCLLISLLLAFQSYSQSQSFGTPDSKWTYDYDRSGVQEVLFDKDTILEGRDCSRYSVTALRLLSQGDTIVTARPSVYICNDDGLVQFSTSTVDFDTLVDFNASIGDTWSVEYQWADDPFETTVTDTFWSEINGELLFGIECEFVNRGNDRWILDTIYDRIGSVNNFLVPYYGWSDIGGFTGGFLRCYNDPQIGSVYFPLDNNDSFSFQLDCGQTTSTDNLPRDEARRFSMQPNPFYDALELTGLGKGEEIKVYTVSGTIVYHMISTATDMVLDLSSLHAGLYFVQVGSEIERIVKI